MESRKKELPVNIEDSEQTPEKISRGFFGLRRAGASDKQFSKFLEVLSRHEQHKLESMENSVTQLYGVWAEEFERLKREFNLVFDLFTSLEQQLPGWYCVSPNLAQWRSVGIVKGGYTFAACIMKNHHRNAPLSEKSLSVTFALDEVSPGIGDERMIGRAGGLDDNLIGLQHCQSRTLREQFAGARSLVEKLEGRSISFRMNHKEIGQEVARLPLSLLEKHSLKELCQGLFVLLNNDVLEQLRSGIPQPESLLLAASDPIVMP